MELEDLVLVAFALVLVIKVGAVEVEQAVGEFVAGDGLNLQAGGVLLDILQGWQKSIQAATCVLNEFAEAVDTLPHLMSLLTIILIIVHKLLFPVQCALI